MSIRDDGLVDVDVNDGVGTLTLNDPDRKNAFSISMKTELKETLHSLSGVRCLVLEGAGDAFCAGGDIDRMERQVTAEEMSAYETIRESLELTNEIVSTIASYPAPVVAKIDGPAVGGGASLALAADIRVASDRAKMGFVFRQVGLGLDGGASYHLPRIVGVDVATELAFTGRIVDAEEAEAIGLVHHSWPEEFEANCRTLIETLAGGPTEALARMKQQLHRSSNRTLEETLEAELIAQATLAETADHEEGVMAFLNDRDPEFVGR